jgi:hypothetical protein
MAPPMGKFTGQVGFQALMYQVLTSIKYDAVGVSQFVRR